MREGGADVAPVVAESGLQLLLGGDQDLRLRRDQIQQRAEAIDRQELGDVRPSLAVVILAGCCPRAVRLRSLRVGDRGLGERLRRAMLLRQLGGGGDLDLLRLLQRALREGGEPAQRFDLHVEHVHAHGALLGRGKHVEQAAAKRELPALLDLLDVLVAERHELAGALLQVQQGAHAQGEGARPQSGVGHLL